MNWWKLFIVLWVVSVLIFMLKPSPVSWDVNGMDNMSYQVEWFKLSASASVLLNVSVSNPNFIPTYVLDGSVDIYFPDEIGRHRFLGTAKLGGFYMLYGVNIVQVSLDVKNLGLWDMAAIRRGKSSCGLQVVMSKGTIVSSVLGATVHTDMVCEQGIKSVYSSGKGSYSLHGVSCKYSLFQGRHQFQHTFGSAPPKLFSDHH